MSGYISEKVKSEVAGNFTFRDAHLPVSKRVEALISAMTLEEKVAQMMGIWKQKYDFLMDQTGELDTEKIAKNLRHGIGQIGRLSDTAGGLSIDKMISMVNKIQKFFCEKTRLGIPVLFHEEGLHGLVAKDATSYPQPIGLASTFNTDLIQEIYKTIARDARRRGVHQILGPVLDVAREPRWGRVEETFGEDPYLISQLGIAVIKGLQGDNCFENNDNVIATLKHFAAHGEPESGTNCAPVNISERLLRDTFLMPFKEVIKETEPGSVMASYNEIDGIPSHANTWLLREVLRKEWGFKGYVVSDYYAVTELNYKEETVSHAVAETKAEAAKLAVKAGVNIELPETDCYPAIAELVKSGQLDESELDELLAPMLEYKFRLGLFDNPYVPVDSGTQNLLQERKLALRAAQETITLLKNDSLLPLDKSKIKTIAVIGPNADRVLLGGYSGTPKYYTTILQGIKDKAGKNLDVLYSEGCRLTVGGSWEEDEVVLPDEKVNNKLITEAVKIAEKSDVVILALGDNEQISREAWNKKHMGDRTDLELFGAQNELVEAITATGKPITAVLINGRPNSISYLNENVPAILECWYLGQETGIAISDVLFGDFNPGGKLPISIPRSVGHIPCFYNRKPSARRGYLFESTEALFPFGFGLSYTQFSLKNIRLEKSRITADESTKIKVDVTNTGERKGSEVIQMYIRDMYSSVTRPLKELKGFSKIFLDAGESQTVVMEITPEKLAFTDVNKNFVVETGTFEIMIGTSSRDQDLQKTILTVY